MNFLGAVDRSASHALEELIAGGYTVIVYPGGTKECLKLSTEGKYDIDFEDASLKAVVEVVNTSGTTH